MMLYSSVSCQLLAQAEEFSSQFILNHDFHQPVFMATQIICLTKLHFY